MVPIADFDALEEAADVLLTRKATAVLAALTALGDDPYREDADVKKLTGPSGRYRLRVGTYRVAYQVEDGELIILVIKAGDRRDVHRAI
ncbi:plasmid stabilization system [Actinobacteria bacterium OK074]|nr:plasmid stabilization system [Actinobacteria bacterium OK074]